MLHGLFDPLSLVLRWTALGTLVVLLSARDLFFPEVRLPHYSRQIPRSTLTDHGTVGSFAFGVQMGLGVVTHLTSASLYAVVGAVLLLGPPITVALAAGAGFSAGRAVPMFARAVSRGRSRLEARFTNSGPFFRVMAATVTPPLVAVVFVVQ